MYPKTTGTYSVEDIRIDVEQQKYKTRVTWRVWEEKINKSCKHCFGTNEITFLCHGSKRHLKAMICAPTTNAHFFTTMLHLHTQANYFVVKGFTNQNPFIEKQKNVVNVILAGSGMTKKWSSILNHEKHSLIWNLNAYSGRGDLFTNFRSWCYSSSSGGVMLLHER